jgi:hypothetical protein
MSALSLALLSAVVFATTNLDDFLVPLWFFSEALLHFRQIVAGQIIGVGFLVAASLIGASIVVAVSPAYVGCFVPLIIGVAKLWKRLVAGHAEDNARLIGRAASKGSSVQGNHQPDLPRHLVAHRHRAGRLPQHTRPHCRCLRYWEIEAEGYRPDSERKRGTVEGWPARIFQLTIDHA